MRPLLTAASFPGLSPWRVRSVNALNVSGAATGRVCCRFRRGNKAAGVPFCFVFSINNFAICLFLSRLGMSCQRLRRWLWQGRDLSPAKCGLRVNGFGAIAIHGALIDK